jgi:hypothetical protein
MARNRKAQSVAIRFGPAVKASVLCLLIGGSGVGYVWQKDQILKLSYEFKRREMTLITLQKENEKLRKQLAFFRSVDYLEGRIKDLKLNLAPPQPSQIWRLTEPGPEPPGQEPAQQLASSNDHAAIKRGALSVVALH